MRGEIALKKCKKCGQDWGNGPAERRGKRGRQSVRKADGQKDIRPE